MQRVSIFHAVFRCIFSLLLLESTAHAQTILPQGIKDLAGQIVTGTTQNQKKKVAVLPFRDIAGSESVFGAYLSEELVTELFKTNTVEIVERANLDQLLGEIKLGQSGVIDPETARHVGRIAGVDAIVTGTITVLESYVSLNCRLVDTESGRVFGAAQARIVKDADVLKILATSSLPATPNSASPSPPPIREIEQAGFRFQLQACTFDGADAVCHIVVTNESSADRELTLFNSDRGRVPGWRTVPGLTRLIDASGNEFFSSEESILGSMRGLAPSARLASKVPMALTLVFPGLPSTSKQASLIEILCRAGSGRPASVGGFGGNSRSSYDDFRIQLRDVPLNRD